jgi:dUTP pyrophosphatase
MIEIKVKKLYPHSKLPTRANDGDAGWDLYAAESFGGVSDLPLDHATIKTGIAVEIPEGYFGLIKPRSSLSAKWGINVTAGVVDCGYRGEIGVVLQTSNNRGLPQIAQGDKIAQMVIIPIPATKVVEVSALSETVRGEKGFGSSGK